MEDKINELLNEVKYTNKTLKTILLKLDDMTSDDKKFQQCLANFGVGICANIVGDRILGL